MSAHNDFENEAAIFLLKEIMLKLQIPFTYQDELKEAFGYVGVAMDKLKALNLGCAWVVENTHGAVGSGTSTDETLTKLIKNYLDDKNTILPFDPNGVH